jgi:N-acetylglucosaminyldiphosphoundecaprenol N-acetyl-beta-D-mannosaminyltransferase
MFMRERDMQGGCLEEEWVRPNRTEVQGCPIDPLTLQESLDLLTSWVMSQAGPKVHISMNAAKIERARRDPTLQEAWSRADLVSADGMGVVWSSRGAVPQRVSGIDVCEALLALSERHGWRPYLLGGRQEVLEDAVREVKRRWPSLLLAGHHHGYVDEEQEPELVRSIALTRPDVLLVGLGSPRQEQFLMAHAATVGAHVSMGVGGTWNVLSGTVKRAPLRIRARGLEWAWRMVQEPRRIISVRTWDTARFAARSWLHRFGKKMS